MNKINDFLPFAEKIVNSLIKDFNDQKITFKEAEEEVVKIANKIGHLIMEHIVDGLIEPTTENVIHLNKGTARYRGTDDKVIIDRFGEKLKISRRRYYIEETREGYHPLDEKMGLDMCRSYSPLMTYLFAFFGGSDAYGPGAEKLGKALGYSISPTTLQNTAEAVGRKIEHNPLKSISANNQNKECDVMMVQIDGTMSPQIKEIDGITGRESMKMPTEYKECNVVVIEKYNKEEKTIRWVGAQYGPRCDFENYVRTAGLKMGQMRAKEIIFLGDGAIHNWEIQSMNFPDAIPILDFYHASEHLAEFCSFFKDGKEGEKKYKAWYKMILEGDIYQMLFELKENIDNMRMKNNDEALKHYNYLNKNKERMHYGIYQQKGYPIGSGLVEGQCKLVVGKRFKGNGMRWKKADNEAILDVRLAILNDKLEQYFEKAS